MKRILIIYPHWVPSNLAGVHRPRLIANYLRDFDWQPVLLTVLPQFYEEKPDPDISKTVSNEIEVFAVKARSVGNPRLIGDIGLRAWSYLKKEALSIIEKKKPDFIWIPIPSFYMAILGRLLHEKTGVPYGIDYIDPSVRDISNRKSLRSKLSILTAKILEPFAVKKAALISGVNENYYLPVYNRNFINGGPPHIAFPYGFDPGDHTIEIKDLLYPWHKMPGTKPLIYAGAFLPKSHLFIQSLFGAIKTLKHQDRWPSSHKLFFLGTGNYTGKSIEDYSRDFGLENEVFEKRERFPYLNILNYLKESFAVMVIGSTEKHYTASKTFQAILSKRPAFCIFHEDSSAVKFLREASADNFLVTYSDGMSEDELCTSVKKKLIELLDKEQLEWSPDFEIMDQFSSRNYAKLFAAKLEEILD